MNLATKYAKNTQICDSDALRMSIQRPTPSSYIKRLVAGAGITKVHTKGAMFMLPATSVRPETVIVSVRPYRLSNWEKVENEQQANRNSNYPEDTAQYSKDDNF